MDDVRFAVVAADSTASRWLSAVSGVTGATVAALHDPDTIAARAASERTGCQLYVDPRMLLVQAPIDAVLLSLAPADNHRYLPLAAERGIPTILLSPPLRSVEEVATHVRAFRQRRLPLLVASAWNASHGAVRREELEQNLGRAVSAHADVVRPVPAAWGWRGDRVAAGGGALMGAAYDAVHLLIRAFGVPDDLVATVSRLPWPEAGPYDVEDHAAVLLRYAGRRVATVRAAWGGGGGQWQVRLVGEARTRIINENSVVECNSADGSDRSETTGQMDVAARLEAACCSAVHQAIAHVRRQSVSDGPAEVADLHEHLPTLAVIETAYLSARTAAPESPRRLLERMGGDLLDGAW